MILRFNLLNNSKLYYIYQSTKESLFGIGVLNQLFDLLLILKKSWYRALGALCELFFMTGFFVFANREIAPSETPTNNKSKTKIIKYIYKRFSRILKFVINTGKEMRVFSGDYLK